MKEKFDLIKNEYDKFFQSFKEQETSKSIEDNKKMNEKYKYFENEINNSKKKFNKKRKDFKKLNLDYENLKKSFQELDFDKSKKISEIELDLKKNFDLIELLKNKIQVDSSNFLIEIDSLKKKVQFYENKDDENWKKIEILIKEKEEIIEYNDYYEKVIKEETEEIERLKKKIFKWKKFIKQI